MSGGYFDYQKYVLRDIARSIARTLQPKPVKETACNKRDTAVRKDIYCPESRSGKLRERGLFEFYPGAGQEIRLFRKS